MSAFPRLIVRNFVELADALVVLKNHRGLSNEALEGLAGLGGGHVDKLLGPARVKNIGKNSLPWMLAALAGRLVLELDPEQEKLMRSRWEQRNNKQIRVNAHPVSIAIVRRVAPIIFAELARKAAVARLQKIPQHQRIKIARGAARARWRSKHEPDRIGGAGIGNAPRPFRPARAAR